MSVWSRPDGKPQLSYAERLRRAQEATGDQNIANPVQQASLPPSELTAAQRNPSRATEPEVSDGRDDRAGESLSNKTSPSPSQMATTNTSLIPSSSLRTPIGPSKTDALSSTTTPSKSSNAPVNVWELRKKQMKESKVKQQDNDRQQLSPPVSLMDAPRHSASTLSPSPDITSRRSVSSHAASQQGRHSNSVATSSLTKPERRSSMTRHSQTASEASSLTEEMPLSPAKIPQTAWGTAKRSGALAGSKSGTATEKLQVVKDSTQLDASQATNDGQRGASVLPLTVNATSSVAPPREIATADAPASSVLSKRTPHLNTEPPSQKPVEPGSARVRANLTQTEAILSPPLTLVSHSVQPGVSGSSEQLSGNGQHGSKGDRGRRSGRGSKEKRGMAKSGHEDLSVGEKRSESEEQLVASAPRREVADTKKATARPEVATSLVSSRAGPFANVPSSAASTSIPAIDDTRPLSKSSVQELRKGAKRDSGVETDNEGNTTAVREQASLSSRPTSPSEEMGLAVETEKISASISDQGNRIDAAAQAVSAPLAHHQHMEHPRPDLVLSSSSTTSQHGQTQAASSYRPPRNLEESPIGSLNPSAVSSAQPYNEKKAQLSSAKVSRGRLQENEDRGFGDGTSSSEGISLRSRSFKEHAYAQMSHGVPSPHAVPYGTPMVFDGTLFYPIGPTSSLVKIHEPSNYTHHLARWTQSAPEQGVPDAAQHPQSGPPQHTDARQYPSLRARNTGLHNTTGQDQTEHSVDTIASATASRLVGQIEFYFSDENLVGDYFLRWQMDPQGGWVPLTLIGTFRRLRTICEGQSITLDSPEVKDILARSATIVLDETGTRVRRRHDWSEWVLSGANDRGSQKGGPAFAVKPTDWVRPTHSDDTANFHNRGSSEHQNPAGYVPTHPHLPHPAAPSMSLASVGPPQWLSHAPANGTHHAVGSAAPNVAASNLNRYSPYPVMTLSSPPASASDPHHVHPRVPLPFPTHMHSHWRPGMYSSPPPLPPPPPVSNHGYQTFDTFRRESAHQQEWTASQREGSSRNEPHGRQSSSVHSRGRGEEQKTYHPYHRRREEQGHTAPHAQNDPPPTVKWEQRSLSPMANRVSELNTSNSRAYVATKATPNTATYAREGHGNPSGAATAAVLTKDGMPSNAITEPSDNAVDGEEEEGKDEGEEEEDEEEEEEEDDDDDDDDRLDLGVLAAEGLGGLVDRRLNGTHEPQPRKVD